MDLSLLVGCPQAPGNQSIPPFGVSRSCDLTSACHWLPLRLRSTLTSPLIAPQESPNPALDEAIASTKMIPDSLWAASKILRLPPLSFPLAAGDLSSLAPEGRLAGLAPLSCRTILVKVWKYLSEKAVGQASAGRPQPAGECRHQAVTVRRRSPPRGECTPRSNPPLQGSQTPGSGRGEGWENTGLRHAITLLVPVFPRLSYNCPPIYHASTPDWPELQARRCSETYCPSPPPATRAGGGGGWQRPCWSLPPH